MSARVTAGPLVLGLLLLGGLAEGALAQTITRVAVAGANLREKPSPDAAVAATVDKGTEVEVLGREGEWLMVRVVATKVEGWVKPEFLEPRAPAPAAAPLAPAPAPVARKASGPPHRLRLDLGGAFAPAPAGFSESRKITQFAEEGRIDTDYSAKGGPGLDAGLLYRATRHLGAAVSFSLVSNDESGTFKASLPHPLYYGKPRQATGELAGKRRETAVHADLVYTASTGRTDLHVFAGPTWTSLRAGLLSDIQYTQSYPYDTVTVTGAPVVEESASKVGFNVGAGVDYRAGARVGLGAQVRWSRAKVTLGPAPGTSVELDAGGLRVGVGGRLFF